MRRLMRVAISATTLLGIVLLALALSGISGLASDLEAATPQPPRAPVVIDVETREIDCPLPVPERPRI